MSLLARKTQTAKSLPVCNYGNPVLREKSVPVEAVDAAVEELAERMLVTMAEQEGIGLAAPQVGQNIRMITLNVPAPNDTEDSPPFGNTPGELVLLEQMPIVLINPQLSVFSEQVYEYNEGCLSMPGIRGCVVRPEFVQLDAATPNGAMVAFRCGGLLSRCLQHEVDHLDGVLFTDHMKADDLALLDDALNKLERQTRLSLKRR